MNILVNNLPTKVANIKQLHDAGWPIPTTIVLPDSHFNNDGMDILFETNPNKLYVRWMQDEERPRQIETICEYSALQETLKKMASQAKGKGVFVVQPMMDPEFGGCVVCTEGVAICEMVRGLTGALVRRGQIAQRVVKDSKMMLSFASYEQKEGLRITDSQLKQYDPPQIGEDDASVLAAATFRLAEKLQGYLIEWLSVDGRTVYGLDARPIQGKWFENVKSAGDDPVVLGPELASGTCGTLSVSTRPQLKSKDYFDFSDISVFAEGSWLSHAAIYRMISGNQCIFSKELYRSITAIVHQSCNAQRV